MNYTPKQLQIMDFIREYRARRNTAPTLEEIGNSLGVHRVTVHQHVAALVKKGAIRKLPQRSRSIEILDPAYLPEATVKVMGRIAAGRPIEAVEDPEPYTLNELLPIEPGQECYLLRVVGQSMVDDHITDGDLVMVDRGRQPRAGEIVVAVVDGEATLKRFYLERGDTIRLQPANATMAAILVRPPQTIDIRGVVRGVLRKY